MGVNVHNDLDLTGIQQIISKNRELYHLSEDFVNGDITDSFNQIFDEYLLDFEKVQYQYDDYILDVPEAQMYPGI